MMAENEVMSARRSAGLLLLGSLFILLVAAIILVASGAFSAFTNLLKGSLDQIAPYADTFRWLNLYWTVGWIMQLLGFSLLALLLVRAGEDQLAIFAFTALLASTMLGVLHGTFHMSVENWAAREAARTGRIPEIYGPLEQWISSFFRIGYIVHLLAEAGIGWGILRSRLLAPWVGWAAIGWSAFWLFGYIVGMGAPGILFIMPAIIGIALLRK